MSEKKRLLLIYPDFLEEEKFNRKKLGNYSEGLASISAVLKQGGHDVQLYHQLYMPDRKGASSWHDKRQQLYGSSCAFVPPDGWNRYTQRGDCSPQSPRPGKEVNVRTER